MPKSYDRSIVRRPMRGGPASEPLATPLYASVVYRSESPDALDAIYGAGDDFTYAREGHPNASILGEKLDWLEGLEGGFVTGSGMAALTAIVLADLKPGQHVVAGNQLYGRSLRLLGSDLKRWNISVDFVDTARADAVAAAIRPETRMVVIEVVSNPTLRIADLAGIAAVTRARGIRLVVDNTFTTARALRPAELGADIVFSSVTKLLAGHSDATLGHVVARDRDLRDALRDVIVTWGLTPSPFDCWMAERGLHSFALRYDKAAENAAELADHLAALSGVEKVYYPGRDDHPDHARARDLLGENYGNMVSFRITGTRDAANRLVRGAPGIAFAPTLGDVGTTLSHPATSSHRAMQEGERQAMGITEGFFRVSVGVEDIELLKAEFEAAIIAATS